ncbi:MAG: response regulator [Candidatus Aureabacteria bacterium]|nr:response regulator [Candidatus Auribacterota bacterium]
MGANLVILDMVMKGMGGVQAFKRIRESARSLPVIICTGYIPDRGWRHILEKEASDFIRKPFTLSELSPRIRKILDGRLL